MAHARAGDSPAIRLEPENEWAWCGDERLELPPRLFALLRHLVEHPNRLITKDELFSAVWRDTVVSEAALTSSIRDLRKALGDVSQAPRYIETVHRRGFRFIGPIAAPRLATPAHRAAPLDVPPSPAAFVGRDAELARLHALFAAAHDGERRLVFVTGEAGIGKTTLVEAFLAGLRDVDDVRIGRGQCVEQYGASEPYLPVLEALGRMGREPRGDALVRVLRRYAPTWLAQLPALLGDDDLDAVQRRAQGTTRERMLREVIEALDALAAETPLVLVLEDLHWCDSATVDLLAMIARRRDPARLLIVATHRPADAAAARHPLESVAHDLEVHGCAEEMALGFLSDAAVGAYLDRRFPRASFAPELARRLHANTAGNPLFLVNVVDDVIAQGHLREIDGTWRLTVPVERVASDVPHTLWQMVEKQLDRLAADEQAVLAVGSVAGAEFSAALASVDGIEPHDAERCCDALARRGQFLRAAGVAEWPDGTVAGRYAFVHALYRDVLYARVSIGHRVGLHLRIGARLERAHGSHAPDVAGELAMHFEHGRDFERAVLHRRHAADVALGRHAYREAAEQATRGLALLEALPESPERNAHELMLQTVLGAAVVATSGWAAPDVARAYARARELCAHTGVTPQLFPVLLGLCGFYLTRGDLRVGREVADQLVALAATTDDAVVRLGAHNMAGLAVFYRGDFVDGLRHFEHAATYDRPEDRTTRLRGFFVDHDPGVSCAAHTAWADLVLGHPDRAAARMRDCLAHARATEHALSVALAYNFASIFYQFRRERDAVREIEAVRLEYATRHDFDLFLLLGEIYRGWLAVEEGREEEGLAQIRYGITAYQAIGAELGRPTFLGILADVCHRLGRVDEALAAVNEALALGEETGLRYWDAELNRVKGVVLLGAGSAIGGGEAATSAERDAEACFATAIEIARRQRARSFELRCTTSLCRLWQRQGKRAAARARLADVYGWFTEGFETPDLVDAKALLDELGTGPGTRRRADVRRRRD